MRIKQLFETSVFAEDGVSEARFIVVPRFAFSSLPEDQYSFHRLGEDLGFDEIREIDASRLVDAFATCLMATEDPEFANWLIVRGTQQEIPMERYDQHIRFAEILALAPIIPFQRNPLNLESAAGIITGASGVGLGAYAGFIVGAGSPLILITVPAGMIIFGAAAGVARALEEGLHSRLKKLIAGP